MENAGIQPGLIADTEREVHANSPVPPDGVLISVRGGGPLLRSSTAAGGRYQRSTEDWFPAPANTISNETVSVGILPLSGDGAFFPVFFAAARDATATLAAGQVNGVGFRCKGGVVTILTPGLITLGIGDGALGAAGYEIFAGPDPFTVEVKITGTLGIPMVWQLSAIMRDCTLPSVP